MLYAIAWKRGFSQRNGRITDPVTVESSDDAENPFLTSDIPFALIEQLREVKQEMRELEERLEATENRQ